MKYNSIKINFLSEEAALFYITLYLFIYYYFILHYIYLYYFHNFYLYYFHNSNY